MLPSLTTCVWSWDSHGGRRKWTFPGVLVRVSIAVKRHEHDNFYKGQVLIRAGLQFRVHCHQGGSVVIYMVGVGLGLGIGVGVGLGGRGV